MIAVADTGAAPVGLAELLAARETRAQRQAALLVRHGTPVMCMTIVMPGPVKDNGWARRALNEGAAEFDHLCARRGWPVLAHERHWLPSGPEAFYAVGTEATAVKAATIKLEEAQPIGRLWDFDVIEPGMTVLSRQALGRPPRLCFVCDKPARECGRAQRHSLDVLLAAVGTIMDGHGVSARA